MKKTFALLGLFYLITVLLFAGTKKLPQKMLTIKKSDGTISP